MFRGMTRASVLGASLLTIAGAPSALSAQTMYFQSCATAGVCGYIEALFTSSILTVRVSNDDATLGSALFSTQIIFANALNAATPGTAFQQEASVAALNSTTAIGTTPSNAWSFSGVGGSTTLDLATFWNVYIEGIAASPFRAAAGDAFAGTWVTHNGFVEFSADLAGVTSFDGNSVAGLGFCTDQNCVQGAAVVATPEPASLTLLATGLAGVVAARRRRKNKDAVI